MFASILPTIVVLGTLIFIHELGHFLACKLVGVSVERFSIGFGPEIFHFQYKETRISLSIIPFGGFVKPKGESTEEMEEKKPEPDDYLVQGVGSKALIVSSGVLMNFVLAFVLFVLVFVMGRPVPLPIVGELMKGYPAESAGIKAGDKIVSVDGKEVADWTTMTLAIFSHQEGPLRLQIERQGQLMPLTITPKEEDAEPGIKGSKKLKRIGIKPSNQVRIERMSFLPAVAEGGKSVVGCTALTYRVLWGLVTGEVSLRNIAGPVGIVAITGRTAKEGIVSLLNLTALLSVNLAVINLLPIPALDGGHLFFLLIEAIRRKSISQKLQERLAQTGFIILMILMVFIVLNDFQNFGIMTKIQQLFHH